MLLIGTAVRISTRVSTCGLTLEALFSGGAYLATLRRRKSVNVPRSASRYSLSSVNIS